MKGSQDQSSEMQNSRSIKHDLSQIKRILVVGNGGRENALAWALIKCPEVEGVWVAPGNGGTENHPGCMRLEIKASDVKGLLEASLLHQFNLIVIGPEIPLADGLADVLRDSGLVVFGPGADGAKLEASKTWAKELMSEASVPTAKHWTVSKKEEALALLKKQQRPLVVKADGLAAGKGVTVPDSIEGTAKAIKEAFTGKFGVAGETLVLEELLQGPEVSVFGLCDGERIILLPAAQDHKRLKEGDLGPNTGGMGAYAPAPLLNSNELNNVQKLVLEPILNAMKERGIDYRGVIYAGLMITSSGAKVIEFNCRFGDPECQTLMPLMGPELARVLYACALGCLDQAPILQISNNCSACVVAAASGYPEAARTGDLITSKIKLSKSIQLFHAGTICDKKGNLLTSGGRVLAVTAQGKDFDQAFSLVYKGLEQISFDGITYRNDIGNQVRHSHPQDKKEY